MANVLINEQYLTDIADAIRFKVGGSQTYTTAEMAPAIEAIRTADGPNALSFDVLLNGTYNGEFYSETATKMRGGLVSETRITSATGLEITEIGDYSFQACQDLSNVNFPKATKIGLGAFGSCKSLTSVDFPLVETVGVGAFVNCANLTDINLPRTKQIADNSFGSCSKLEKLKLPSAQSLHVTGNGMFLGCDNLTHLIFGGGDLIRNLPSDISSWPAKFRNGTAWVYVPSSKYMEYKYYTEYVNRIDHLFRRIEDYPEICN